MASPRFRIACFTVVFALGSAVAYTNFRREGSDQTAQAALTFLKQLTPDQLKISQLAYAAPERVDWHFIPKPARKGMQVKEMTPAQREAAFLLLRSVVSQLGYKKATTIMSMEKLLFELEKGKGANIRDPERYFFTVFGDPAGQEQWGLSIEGHHMSLNFVLKGDQVISSTPQVFAANPATIKTANSSGFEIGARILAREEQLAFDLVKSLTAEQLAVALIEKTAPKEVRNAGIAQPPTDAAVGIAAGKLTGDQQKVLRSLLEEYCGAMPDHVAQARLKELDAAGFDKVHFAWAGATEPGVGHYYRVQGPTFLVEFVNTQPDAAGNIANHIHCLWRDIRGDFALPAKAE
jgi:Protein of unknown function (DUF3500)